MRSVFVANGPAFKRQADQTTTHIAITDIYLLICKIFGVTPAANNGSEHSVLAILNQGYLKSINHHFLPHTTKNLWIGKLIVLYLVSCNTNVFVALRFFSILNNFFVNAISVLSETCLEPSITTIV